MTDRAAQLGLKERVPRTWGAFFERHGSFTAAQLAAMPVILDGRNVILSAPTASGKTEAVVAPLIERHCPAAGRRPSPLILYLAPTRALVNDLAARLAHPLTALGLTLGVRTGDRTTFRPTHPPDLLLTTPESTDSLLTTRAGLLANLRAVIIDEVHLFDGTPRGDHLRVLLNRIRRVRRHAFARGDAPDDALQYAALSATIAEPGRVAARYFEAAAAIHIPGQRAIEAEHRWLMPESSQDLLDYLATFRARGWRKALVFCNSRAEVEAYAAATRARSPFGDAVYVHYSNIEAERRREIEQQFAAAGAAICFASSTLELGIDIGAIDIVIMIGPPGNAGSFVQRIGRGNRRRGRTRVACFARTAVERLLFEALCATPETAPEPVPTFRPAVAVQQIFSLLKQSPTGAVRLPELAELFAGMLSPLDLEAVLSNLQTRRYVQVGQPGEWRADLHLNELVDRQGDPRGSLSIYSNIQGAETRLVDIRDQHTRRTVARVDAQWLDRPVLTLEGRPVSVAWSDGEVMWVAAYQGHAPAEHLDYRSTRPLLSYEVARLLPARCGLAPEVAPFVAAPEGWWWFHWLGDIYGRALLDLWRAHRPVARTEQLGLCLHLMAEPQAPPAWSEGEVVAYLEADFLRIEQVLALGPCQHLLPTHLRRRAVVEQFDVARFLAAVAALRPVAAPEVLTDDLIQLLAAVPAQRGGRPTMQDV